MPEECFVPVVPGPPRRARAHRRRATCAVAQFISEDGLEADFTRPSRTGNFGRVYFARYPALALDVVVKCANDEALARALYDMEAHCNARMAARHGEASRYPRYLGQVRVPTAARVGMVWAREATETLEDYLTSARVGSLAAALGVDSGGSPRRRLAAALLHELLICLEQLWDYSIVHRDMKPGNLLVVPGSAAPLKVIDLGSACEWGMLGKRNLKNATCDPVYVPPERRLNVMRPADRFDIYSVGLIVLRAALPSLTNEQRMADFVADVLAPCRYSFSAAVNRIINGNNAATSDLRQDFIQLDAERNDDLFAILSNMLAEQPENRATAKSALRCRFLAVEGIPSESTGKVGLSDTMS